MLSVITLSECNCGVQRARRAIFRKTPSWATSVINLVQQRNRLKILENNKNIHSIISINTNILLRRFRLKFLRIMYSTSCYKERLNFENTLYMGVHDIDSIPPFIINVICDSSDSDDFSDLDEPPSDRMELD
jgi:hypothetical protein